MKCKYKKFLKAAYIDYSEDYCGHGSGAFTKPAVTTPIIVFIGATATIACAINGATIYYTLDGSIPTSSSTLYTGAITLTLSCTIKAIAVKPGMSDSLVASENYIHYLTTWRLVGNSSVHTDPYLTSWKVSGKTKQQFYLTQWKLEGNSYVYTETYPDDVVLPNGYKRCKYLEFHGTEYINSGIVNRSDIGFSLDLSTTSDGKTIIGARSSINDGVVFGCNYVEDNTNYTPIAYGSYTIGYANRTIIADGSRHNIVLDWQQAKIDSDSFGIDRGDTFPQLSIYIGTWNDNNVPDSRMFVGKIYSVVLYCNDGNLFYGIPCLDNNNVPCLYDAVSGTSFYNAGTGTFGYEEWSLLVEIRSCGDYSAVDGKYHVKIESEYDVHDIALDEPLRKVGDVADTVEFSSGTEGKALLTRRIASSNLGTLDFIRTTTSVANTYRITSSKLENVIAKVSTSNTQGNIICAIYNTTTASNTWRAAEVGIAVNNTGLLTMYDDNYNQSSDTEAFLEHINGVEIIYELETPTTELIDVPQIHATASGRYVPGNTTYYSSFTYATPQFYSCGDYSDVDGKYHVKISNGATVYDVALNEPLRGVSNTYALDTIEFPSNTEGKALVTRNVKQINMSSLLWVQEATSTSGKYRYLAEAPDAYGVAANRRLSAMNNGGYANNRGSRVGNPITSYGTIGMYPTYQESQVPHFVIYDPNYDKQEDLSALLTHLGDKTLVYILDTPTTELVDVSPFPVSPTDTYTSANETTYSEFEHTEHKEIWSCGEYNATDGKYHILVQPSGDSIVDIALTEPLRKVDNVTDTIEFPSTTEGKALVTRRICSLVGLNNNIGTLSIGSSKYAWVQPISVYGRSNPDLTIYANIVSTKYPSVTRSQITNMIEGCALNLDAIHLYDKKYYRSSDKSALIAANADTEFIYERMTPTTELIDVSPIKGADSYACVITPGAKAVEWSSFETE